MAIKTIRNMINFESYGHLNNKGCEYFWMFMAINKENDHFYVLWILKNIKEDMF